MRDCRVGLALGAGAAQGLAHIGILKVMERESLFPHLIAGTSMGAFIGALWATGMPAAEIEFIIEPFKQKISAIQLIDLTFPKLGLIKGRKIRDILASQIGNKTFNDLKLPLKIVTCDIAKREEVVLDKGSLVDAVMASIAIPGMFEPVVIDGRQLVDGGIINPLPTNVLFNMGISKVIAVNTLPSPQDVCNSKKKRLNIFDMIVRNIQASEYLLAEASCRNVDLVMHPVLPGVDWYEINEGRRIIDMGEAVARENLPRIKELTHLS